MLGSLTAVPKQYYATEKKMIHKVGYTIALAMMGIGVLETLHSIPYIVKGQSNLRRYDTRPNRSRLWWCRRFRLLERSRG